MNSLLRLVAAGAFATGLAASPVMAQTGSRPDEAAWARVRASSDRGELQGFLARFPDSEYAEIARGRIELIDSVLRLQDRERELDRKREAELSRERAERAAREAEERMRAARERSERAAEARRRAEEAAARVREERLARERAEAERRREAERLKAEAVQRLKADAARRRAEEALRQLEQDLARRKLESGEPQRVRRAPTPSAEPSPPAAPVRPGLGPVRGSPRSVVTAQARRGATMG